MGVKPKLDPLKLTPEQRDKLEQWEMAKDQLQTLQDIAMMCQELINVADDTKKESSKLEALGAILTDSREQLIALNKKETPEAPDYAKPVVEAVAKLEKAVRAINIKPEVKVDSPQVNVEPARVDVDLRGVEKIIKVDIPKAFSDAIQSLPQPEEKEETDYTDKFDSMIKWLKDIDTASRMKSQFPVSQLNSIKDSLAKIEPHFTEKKGAIGVNGSIVSLDVSECGSAMIMISGTYAAVNIAFEGSIDGGGTWDTLQVARIGANTVETTSGSLTSTARIWECGTGGLTNIRVRATAYTSGRADILIKGSPTQTEPIPAIAAHAVTGSGNFAVTQAAHATNNPVKARDGVAGGTDTGNAIFYIRRDTPTTVTPIAGDYELAQIDAQGSQWVHSKIAQTPSQSSVAGSATSVTLLASNTNRLGATIANDSTATLYLKLGATASTTSYTVKLVQDAYYEVPFNYTGIIDGIWGSATGNARITELT